MTVKLGGSLPDEEQNGTYLLQEALSRRPDGRHVLVAVVDCGRHNITFESGTREITPVMRVLYVEPVREEEDVNDVVAVLGRARATRLGRDELDFEEFGVGDPFESLARDVIDGIRQEAAEKEQQEGEQNDD